MEEWKPIFIMLCFIFLDLGLQKLASPGCLVGWWCPQALGCSRSGIPTSSSRKDEYWATFPQFGIGHSYYHQLQRYFCNREDIVLLGVAKEELMESLLSCFLQWRSDPLIRGVARKIPGQYFRSLAWFHTSIISHCAAHGGNCVILEEAVREGFLEFQGGYFWDKWISPLYWRHYQRREIRF